MGHDLGALLRRPEFLMAIQVCGAVAGVRGVDLGRVSRSSLAYMAVTMFSAALDAG